jgi:outer membrane protein
MKTTIKIFLAAAFVLLMGSAEAQNLKFGHINVQELLSLMPERDSAELRLKAYGKDLSEQIDQLQVEYNNKVQNYLQKKDSFTPAIREMREKEIGELEQRIQEFQQTAQQDFQRMQGELMRPVIEKADAAIKKIGKANGFIYVFDISTGGVIYFSETSTDIMPLVKKELNIKK